jgi:hypothetical protein
MPEFIVVDQVAIGTPDDQGHADHVHHMRGETITLSEEVAASYVEDGALRPAPKSEPESKSEPAPKGKGG